MLANIIAFIQFLPKLIDLANRIGSFVKSEQMQAWMNDLEKTIDGLDKAQTPEQKRSSARDLVGLIRRM